MKKVESVEELEELYGAPGAASIDKVADHLTPLYHRWISASRFCILSTIGPEGTDASPRGDVDPVVRIADPKTLLLPDWRGNNRMDSLRNIVRDERVSLMFMVPGSTNVVRVNGAGAVTIDGAVTSQFEQNGKHPRSVVVITVGEVYFQCAKAIMRSELWGDVTAPEGLPTAGQFVREVKEEFDAEGYDSGYAEYAKGRMW